MGHKFHITELDTGYRATLTKELLRKVRTDCSVQFVQDDVYGHLKVNGSANIAPKAHSIARRGIEQDEPWPLYQLSASEKDPSDETYYYQDNPGQGVDVYIIDNGIKHPQDEFKDKDGNDRVIDLFNFSTDPDYSDTADEGGHGTFVASAIGGNKYGVAKAATLFNVKYERNGNVNAARLVQALDAITDRHKMDSRDR